MSTTTIIANAAASSAATNAALLAARQKQARIDACEVDPQCEVLVVERCMSDDMGAVEIGFVGIGAVLGVLMTLMLARIVWEMFTGR